MQKYKIVNVTKELERFIVEVDFLENEEVVGSIKHGFPLTLPESDIEKEVAKACRNFFAEKEAAKIEVVRMEKEKQALKTASALTNKEGEI